MIDRRGVTFTEALVLGAICVVAILLDWFLLRGLPIREREGSGRTMCGTRLRGIAMAMNSYSLANRDLFPIAGGSDPHAVAIGFGEGIRSNGNGSKPDNNVTASLWLMIRDQSVSPEVFICPYSMPHGSASDPVTLDGTSRGAPANLMNTHDFMFARNLSYSVMNMH